LSPELFGRHRWGHLSIAYTKTWQEGMTAGAGFIAVGLVIFATVVADTRHTRSYLFGGAVALQLQLQRRGANVSPFPLDMIPYLLVLLAVDAFWSSQGTPSSPLVLRMSEGTG